MYHGHFNGTHYDAGFRWGQQLRKHGTTLDFCPTFALTADKYAFAAQCKPIYQQYYPKVLQEIAGIADGNGVPAETLQAMLFSMYCFEFDNKCTCFALSTGNEILFCRNSDFLVSLEKLYMNCLYNLDGTHSFNGNTTAYVQMEDGVNRHGLAAGLTFVYPHLRKPGLNAGMLVRYILEHCTTTKEAISALQTLPIASCQTITLADATGEIAVVECNAQAVTIIPPAPGTHFVATANNFNAPQMAQYRNPPLLNDWQSGLRYQTAVSALSIDATQYSPQFVQDILSGNHGFLCQYDRKKGADTVWSVVYDLKRKEIWRVEGNPGRKPFRQDTRMKLLY